MNRKKVKRYLLDFIEKPFPDIYKRDYEIKPTNRIQVLIGSRRVGKTFILFQTMQQLIKNKIKKKQILYLNFEHPLLGSLKFDELSDLFELYWSQFPEIITEKLYIFIDEPHNLPNWDKTIRALQDDYQFPIYITGSSSKLLSGEISTSLRGRTLTNFIYPLSFSEFLSFKMISFTIDNLSTKKKSKLLSLMNEYLEYGGYPEVVLEPELSIRTRILKDLIDLTIYRDLIDRYSIRNTGMIKFLIEFLIQNTTNQISIHKIYNQFKSQGLRIDKNTLYEYFDMLEDISFIHKLKKFSSKLRVSDVSPYKIYLNDPGILNIFLRETPSISLENHVYIELLRRTTFNPTLGIYFWHSLKQWEIDFIITEKKEPKLAIQVSYSLKDPQTYFRETRSLQKFSKNYSACKLIIITFNEESNELSDESSKISIIPFWKWCLNKFKF